jgi:hypothetical protein
MSKHTPGPWLHRAKSDSVHRPPPYEPYRYGDTIFVFHDEAGPNDADLALILAAPDLLNALTVLVEVAEARGIPCNAARAAIFKATGEA